MGSTSTGAFGDAQHVALANLVAEHGHFGQPRREQPAVAEAGGFAAAGNANFDVELIAFLNARTQQRPAPAPATCWARRALRWGFRCRGGSSRRAVRPAAATAADRRRCRPGRSRARRLRPSCNSCRRDACTRKRAVHPAWAEDRAWLRGSAGEGSDSCSRGKSQMRARAHKPPGGEHGVDVRLRHDASCPALLREWF